MIIPAIIPKSLKDLRNQLARVPFASQVQIDVVDGVFAPQTSWPYAGDVRHFDLVNPIPDFKIGIDLMAQDIIPSIIEWLSVDIERMIIHIEAASPAELEQAFNLCEQSRVAVGLAIENDTTLKVVEPYLDRVDFVQVMGIAQIGSQGQPFDERVLQRIVDLKSLHSDLVISVDGSVNERTLPRLLSAGAERFVVGSAIMGSTDPQRVFDQLSELSQAT